MKWYKIIIQHIRIFTKPPTNLTIYFLSRNFHRNRLTIYLYYFSQYKKIVKYSHCGPFHLNFASLQELVFVQFSPAKILDNVANSCGKVLQSAYQAPVTDFKILK